MSETEDKNYKTLLKEVIEQKAEINKKEEWLIEKFYSSHEKPDVVRIIDLLIEKGNPRKRQVLEEVKNKFIDGNLEAQDLLLYEDMYDIYKDSLRNKRR